MKYYDYKNEANEYRGISENAEESPLEKGAFLFPASSTQIEPLVAKSGFAVCFSEADNSWKYIEDNRGKIFYSTQTKEKIIINSLLQSLTNLTQLKPDKFDVWDGEKWKIDLDALKEDKIAQIDAKLAELEFSTIEFKGDTFWGREKDRRLLSDTINLIANVLSGTVPEYLLWRSQSNVNHKFTVDDFKGLAAAFAQRTAQLASKSWQLKDKVRNATTKEEIEEIKWTQ